jgi:membrane protein DedA with SNARE-associated domain
MSSRGLTSIIELLVLLLTSLGLNLIPFASPSNLFIASSAALMTSADPIGIGLIIALGSATAKSVHYVITYFAGKHMGKQRRERLDSLSPKLRRWGAIALFIAAATPVPDEPVVIPMGLLKYNPAKFFVVFFFGKLVITVPGAYLGKTAENIFSPLLSPAVIAVASVVLTVAVTVILLRLDFEGLARKMLQKIRNMNSVPPREKNEQSSTI